MRKYETIFISDPDLKDQARLNLFEKVRNIIAKENGIILDFDEWGNKKLAYEIKKKLRGHYVCVTYGGTGDLVKELERNFRLTDDVLKFMTILLSDDVTAEQLEKEVQDAEDAKLETEKAKKPAVEVAAAEEPVAEEPAVEEPVAEEPAVEVAPKDDEKVEETLKETE